MKIKAYKTIKGKPALSESYDFSFSDYKEKEAPLICIFPDAEYQTINGFGGAFTEAASTTLDKLGEENRRKVLKMYFDSEEGIAYNFGRVHINSCDFSLGNYTYVEEGDETLETFNIERETKSVIPMVKEAMEYGEIDLFTSPWSPPAYMKTTGRMNQGGKLKAEYAELWSEYFVKFINAFAEEGIKISAVTVQNEPKAVQTWDSCVYTAEEERDFVKNYLGPKMKAAGIDIYFWDHNKERVVERASVMLSDSEAAKYISGIAFHWYSGDHFEQLEIFKKLWGDKALIFSEGCYEYSLGETDTVKIGEKYAHDMIGNFNNYCSAFCDWNLLLDEKGGPNHVGNYCDAPIMADTQNDKIYVHDSYYYIGHFSKFVKKGAVRIGSSRWTDALDTVSFKNPDGTIVTVVLNRNDNEFDFSFALGGEIIDVKSEAHSIATYIFEK